MGTPEQVDAVLANCVGDAAVLNGKAITIQKASYKSTSLDSTQTTTKNLFQIEVELYSLQRKQILLQISKNNEFSSSKFLSNKFLLNKITHQKNKNLSDLAMF